MMTTYGYARTSTSVQLAGLADPIAKLKAAGCDDQSSFRERVSNMKMEERVEFAKVLGKLKKM
jgi:DNA invertase Pin-like site-specific DNA recombinase